VIFAVVLGTLKRLTFEGPSVEGKPHRLSGDFGFYGFTGIRLVTSYLLLWVFLIPTVRRDWSTMKLWLVNYLSFAVWHQLISYYILNPLNLDPSGHICCTLIALSLAETQWKIGSPLGDYFFWFMAAHSCVTLYFTAYVYHSVLESYLGLTVGLVLVYGSRLAWKPFSDLVDLVFSKRKMPGNGSNVFRQGDYEFELS